MEKRRRRIEVAKATRQAQPRQRTGWIINHCQSSGVVSRETTTIRKSKATRRRSTTMSAVKRGAAKLPEIAYPYHDDIAVSRRSQSYGVEDSKSHDHPIERAHGGLLENGKRRRRIEVAKATRQAQPRQRTGMEHQPTAEAAAS